MLYRDIHEWSAKSLLAEKVRLIGVLNTPVVIYQNGRESHEVANECLDEIEDALISFIGLQVKANGLKSVYVERDGEIVSP